MKLYKYKKYICAYVLVHSHIIRRSWVAGLWGGEIKLFSHVRETRPSREWRTDERRGRRLGEKEEIKAEERCGEKTKKDLHSEE